jgi:hypothetical protein
MRCHNNIGPQVAADATSFGWSQSMFATKLQLAGFDISRGGVFKIEARLRFVDDRDLMFLAEVLKVPIQELFPRRESAGRLSDFMQKLQMTRFVPFVALRNSSNALVKAAGLKKNVERQHPHAVLNANVHTVPRFDQTSAYPKAKWNLRVHCRERTQFRRYPQLTSSKLPFALRFLR